ncbi:MAG TPA: class I SAM-dependent methyltransferase, partial [Steroidobacteraceae bacterium]|nr:class I SAM-dependent methyltransferase [Steroidobacteraceae bacterium]
FAADLAIFEIDHPATQALKIQRLKECGTALPEPVHFIAADLAREANFATLRSIASYAYPGSELAFTYLDERALASQSESFREVAKTVASMGEPFQSGFRPESLGGELRDCGLHLLEDLDGERMAARYARPDLYDAGTGRFSHIALARAGV